MNAFHVLFRSDRFNLSKLGEHFVNPCCFGEDLAQWFRKKLSERGIAVREPYQEDWGWELPVGDRSVSYYLCMSGNADNRDGNPDQGEWRIIVEKKRSIAQRLFGKGKIQTDDAMVRLVVQILQSEESIRDVRIEREELRFGTRDSGLSTRD